MSSHCQCDTAVTIRYHARPAPFPSGCFCVCVCLWGQALSLFYDKDVTYPAQCVFVWERQRKNHDSTTAEAHQWNSSSSLNPLKWDLTRTLTWTYTGYSACQGLITLRVVQLEYCPQCPQVIARHYDTKMAPHCVRWKVTELITWAAAFSAAFKSNHKLK